MLVLLELLHVLWEARLKRQLHSVTLGRGWGDLWRAQCRESLLLLHPHLLLLLQLLLLQLLLLLLQLLLLLLLQLLLLVLLQLLLLLLLLLQQQRCLWLDERLQASGAHAHIQRGIVEPLGRSSWGCRRHGNNTLPRQHTLKVLLGHLILVKHRDCHSRGSGCHGSGHNSWTVKGCHCCLEIGLWLLG